MESLKERIRTDGRVIGNDVLKIDSFLNHQLDPALIQSIGHEFAARFRDAGVTRILTIEASGIPVAMMAGLYLNVPVVFAKKSRARTQAEPIYSASLTSFTKCETVEIVVSQRYLDPHDRILIIDDFLATGEATTALRSLVAQAGATLAGIGIVVEKGFQSGGQRLRAEGIHLESLVIIESLSSDGIRFADAER